MYDLDTFRLEMFFSRTRKRWFQGLCLVAVTVWCLVHFKISVLWPQKGLPPTIPPKADGWNNSDEYQPFFYLLGGNGLWIPRASAGGSIDKLPPRCAVKQVHILLRHAERYPTKNAGARHVALLKRLQDPELLLRGSLSFLPTWSYFTDLANPAFENLTKFGPYAGTTQAHRTGTKLRHKYGHLISSNTVTKFWTCSSPRDIETATHFATGFFGHDWNTSQRAQLHVIPETAERGADTLTPGDTCSKYRQDKIEGHNHGYIKLAQWQEVFSADISYRLRDDAGGLQLTPIEVYSMMEMCGFEILARGYSQWCDVFTQEEWLQFEYARDLLHFYRAGPGNKYAGAMGQVWLDAAHEIMTRDTHQGIYLSFAHDSDIIAVFAALGVLDEIGTEQYLPTGHIKVARRWRTSDITPMGGYLVLEKVHCNEQFGKETSDSFVRLLVNDGLFDLGEAILPSQVDGATTLREFGAYIKGRGHQFGSFVEVCGLPQDARSKITFFGK